VARLREVADVREWSSDLPPDRESLTALIGDAEAVLAIGGDALVAAVLAACPNLRIVALASAGYDSVDVDAAHTLGIAVTNTPGVLHETTADLAFGLILAARRRIAEGDRYVRSGSWERVPYRLLFGHDVHGAQLGIIGYGQIGHAVARRAHGFGMRVVHYSRTHQDDELSTWMPLDELLATSDIVSVHVPLSDQTRGLIGERELRLMKPTATLVNTARGPVIDETALVRALREERIGSAGLDVQSVEPNPDASDPLLEAPNCVVLPHIGSATESARAAMVDLAAANIEACLAGRPLLSPIPGS
jgi:glyoxylate reductase